MSWFSAKKGGRTLWGRWVDITRGIFISATAVLLFPCMFAFIAFSKEASNGSWSQGGGHGKNMAFKKICRKLLTWTPLSVINAEIE